MAGRSPKQYIMTFRPAPVYPSGDVVRTRVDLTSSSPGRMAALTHQQIHWANNAEVIGRSVFSLTQWTANKSIPPAHCPSDIYHMRVPIHQLKTYTRLIISFVFWLQKCYLPRDAPACPTNHRSVLDLLHHNFTKCFGDTIGKGILFPPRFVDLIPSALYHPARI